jgi:hypothetical protein
MCVGRIEGLPPAPIYEFADEIGGYPMKLQKIDSISLRNSFDLCGMGLVSKLHCIRASQ